MSMNRVPGRASSTASAPPGPRTAICERLARRRLAPKLASPFQHVDEAVEAGRDQAGDASARWQLDVQDQPGSPEFDRRALPDQHPHDRIAVWALAPALRWAKTCHLTHRVLLLARSQQVPLPQPTA